MTPSTPPSPRMESITSLESDSELLLPLYTPSTTLPPAYTTHRTDKLLLSSSSSSSPPSPPSGQSTTSPTSDPLKIPIFSITGHLRLKIYNPLQLLHRFLFTFLLLNTALFALLVYKLDETTFLTVPGIEYKICVCPLPSQPEVYHRFEKYGNFIGGGECYAFFNNDNNNNNNGGVGILKGGRREYEKLLVWQECIEEVGRSRRWREWILWVVMPVMCVVETVAAGAWWWCLREVEREEEKEEREREEQEVGQEGVTVHVGKSRDV
ncbi:hypothetical protein EYR41_005316 [Orbilia oligospora]|uniref:Uncharacterized protein n=1 Tax=Orbilia oligospora TaxID=2813651 RepID=A0A7C8P3H4_ORBOL|nr:hypothetical protein TWF751_003271 [Orbilia oligospora]TGJ69264.1 hypothetical protein EYR41_005316 [Orbilia oligospora]